MNHPCVEAIGVHQGRVGACFDDAAAVEDDDLVRVADRGEAVRDDDRGPVTGEPGDGLLDQRLRLRVDRGGGLVEDEDGGILEDGSGD